MTKKTQRKELFFSPEEIKKILTQHIIQKKLCGKRSLFKFERLPKSPISCIVVEPIGLVRFISEPDTLSTKASAAQHVELRNIPTSSVFDYLGLGSLLTRNGITNLAELVQCNETLLSEIPGLGKHSKKMTCIKDELLQRELSFDTVFD